MARIFRNPIRRKIPETGKEENAVDSRGKTLYSPNWRTLIVDHEGKRKTYTLGTDKANAQKQADMLEQREREIINGIRAKPAVADQNAERPFEEVCQEYFKWGRARGGKNNMPWDDEYAAKKERSIEIWRTFLSLEKLGDLYGILPKLEKECHRMLEAGKAGKTVAHHAQALSSFIKWCKKRKYLTEDPLAELGKFDTSPKRIRRAMIPDELRSLLDHCAPHRRLLYEVAFCSGLREDELRQLEPDMLDREECALRIPKYIDKDRKDRVQYLPVALMERLVAFIDAGEAKKIYARTYRQQGERKGKKKPPKNPLLYVPTNSATMLKRDLDAAGIPHKTPKGVLDFHALRTAYINFVLDVASDVKTAQELARHATAEMTLNVYGRAKEDRLRAVVESVGQIVFNDDLRDNLDNAGQQNRTIFAQGPDFSTLSKVATLGNAEGCNDKNMVRKRGLEPPRPCGH